MNGLVPDALRPALVELVLAGGFALLVVASRVEALRRRAGDLALLVFAATAVAAVVSMDAVPGWLVPRLLVVDPFAGFAKFLLAMSALGSSWLATRTRSEAGVGEPWSWAALAASLFAACAMAGASGALAAWASLELASLATSVWIASWRQWPRAIAESVAGLLRTTAASALLLLGFALLAGVAGSLDYATLARKLPLALAMPGGRYVVLAGTTLVLAGFALRVAAFPWQGWRAALAEGAPVALVAWTQLGGTVAGLAMTARLLRSGLSRAAIDGSWTTLPGVDWPGLVSAAAMATMLAGSVAALRSISLKRLVAWLAVTQAGFLLAGLAVLGDDGLAAMMFHLVASAMAVVGMLAALAPVVEEAGSEDIEVLRGLARRRGGSRPIAFALAVTLMSLSGIPFLAGFEGRARLLAAVLECGRPVLTLAGAVASLAGFLCCAKLVAMMLDRPRDPDEPVLVDFDVALLAGLLVAGTVALGVAPGALAGFVERSVVFFGG